jgi:hypothetical protein
MQRMSVGWAPRSRILPIALGALAALWTFTWTHAYGLFGFDSYPILLTSRVQNAADFFGNFTEELMDGRFTGHFYRPVLNLSFALDAALWNLHPAGYQWTNAVLFGACVTVTFVLTRRILGPRAWIGPSIAMAAFCFHPTHVEVIPVPARRPEFLAWLFSAGAMAWQLAIPARAGGRRLVYPALLSLAAMLSKETAFLLPFWIATTSPDRNVRSAIRRTGRMAGPSPASPAFSCCMAWADTEKLSPAPGMHASPLPGSRREAYCSCRSHP